jgi:hypothetical protein
MIPHRSKQTSGGNPLNRIRGVLLLIAVVAVYTRLGMMFWAYFARGEVPSL